MLLVCISTCWIAAMPIDYDDISEKLSYGYKYGEPNDDVNVETQESGSRYDTGIFTKYPDTPTEDADRKKRNAIFSQPSIDHILHEDAENSNSIRSQRQTETESKFPLQNWISAIESKIVNSADEINAKVVGRGKRSSQETTIDKTDPPLDNSVTDNVQNVNRPQRQTAENELKIPLQNLISTIELQLVHSADEANDHIIKRNRRSPQDGLDGDVNKDLFEGIFEYTRPQRETNGEIKKTISLSGIINAVEDTFVHSAERINSPRSKRNTEVDEATSEKRIRLARDLNKDDSSTERSGKGIHLLRITPDKISDLTLLNPITFKPAPAKSSDSKESDESVEVSTVASTILGIKKENVEIIHSSENTHYIKDENDKISHIQHQQITQAVFKSKIPIIPTIPPKRRHQSVDSSTEVITESFNDTGKSKLKEKIAEVEAIPVILSTGL